MQKYLAVYRKEGDNASWCQAFCKTKEKAIQVCRDKAKNERVTNVWICEWRNPQAEVECLIGHPNEGERVADSIVKALRADNSIVTRLKNQEINVVNTKPRIKIKAAPMTPVFRPPYDIKKAE